MAYSLIENVKGATASATIYVDSFHNAISYCAFPKGGAKLVIESAFFNSIIFSPEFFDEFTNILLKFNEKYHNLVGESINVVLSDNAVTMDIISVPVYKGANRDSLLQSSIKNLFIDSNAIKSHGSLISQTKQSITCSYSFMSAKMLNDLRASCLKNKINVKNISFSANATAIALDYVLPKLKLSDVLFLDIQPDFSRFVFLLKGKCVCFYSLPFGYELLESEKVVAENMLFNHDLAELEVLNARERAKSKKLTVLGDKAQILDTVSSSSENPEAIIDNTDSLTDDDEEEVEEQAPVVRIKTLPKKVEKFLPKYMQRPEPTTSEELKYENFRQFIKWAINLLHSNEKVTALGKFESVLVNIPEQYSFLFDYVNKEEEENGIKFVPVSVKEQHAFLQHVELCGGFIMKNSNVNIF